MHSNGHVKDQPQERHLENFDGFLHSEHCGYVSAAKQESPPHCRRTGTGARHRRGTAELVAAWSQGRPNPKSCSRNRRPPSPPHPPPCTIRKPTLVLPCAALDRCNNDRRRSVYRLGTPGVRGSPFPEGRRRSTDKSFGSHSVGSATHHLTRLAAPAETSRNGDPGQLLAFRQVRS